MAIDPEWDAAAKRDLVTTVQTRSHNYHRFMNGYKAIRQAVDMAACQLAKDNAAWHDDPTAPDHPDFHAPPEVQFNRAVRDEAIVELVSWFLAAERTKGFEPS